jgi:preprotein translocase subunit YajC
LLFIVVIFGAVYMLFIRPRQQRMRQQQTVGRQLSVGDPVVTAGGIHGRLVAMDADVAEVEVAPGVVLTFLRRAVNPRPDAPAATTPEPADEEWPVERGRAAESGDEEPPGDKPNPHP